MRENLKMIGARGERIVRAHLEAKGWRVLASNYRCRAGEMDLIAEDTAGAVPVLVFVEVKTRLGASHGSPIEAVDSRKVERLRNIALAYLSERGAGGDEPACRFDVAEVVSRSDGFLSVRLHQGIQGGA